MLSADSFKLADCFVLSYLILLSVDVNFFLRLMNFSFLHENLQKPINRN